MTLSAKLFVNNHILNQIKIAQTKQNSLNEQCVDKMLFFIRSLVNNHIVGRHAEHVIIDKATDKE
jgi:hypothetical protein